MLLFLESNTFDEPAREILVCCSAKFLAPLYESLPRSYQHNLKINIRYKIKKLAFRRKPECSPSVFFLLNEGESYPRLSCRSDSSSQGATSPCLKLRQAKPAPNNISQCRFAIFLRESCTCASSQLQISYACCSKCAVQVSSKSRCLDSEINEIMEINENRNET
jgi:hypothetical protein